MKRIQNSNLSQRNDNKLQGNQSPMGIGLEGISGVNARQFVTAGDVKISNTAEKAQLNKTQAVSPTGVQSSGPHAQKKTYMN